MFPQHTQPNSKSVFAWPWVATVPLLAAAIILSVFFQGTDSIYYPIACVLLLLFCALLLLPCVRQRYIEVPFSNSVWLPAVFGGYLIAALLWTTVPYISIIFTLIIAMLPLLVLAQALAPARERRLFAYPGAFIAVAAGFAVWALVQFFFFLSEYGPRIHHPMLNPNDLCSFFNLALLPAITFYFAAATGWQKAGSFALAVLLYFAVLITQSRGGIISFCVSFAVLVPFLLQKRRYFPWPEVVAFVLVLISAPFIVDHFSHGHMSRTIAVLGDIGNAGSVSDRMQLWQSTMRMALDHFWKGTGLGTFYYYYTAYRNPADESDGYFAHMDPLQFWAETGIAAPVLFYAALLAVLSRTIKAMRAPRVYSKQHMLMMGMFCGMLAVLLNTHISFHLYMPALIVPLAIIFGCWYLLCEKLIGSDDRTTIRLGGWRSALFGVLLLSVLLPPAIWSVMWAKSTHVLYKLSVPEATMTESELTKLETKALKAQRYAPYGYGKFDEYLARLYLVRLSGDIRHMDKSDRTTFYMQAVRSLDSAEKKNPAYVAIWDMRARLFYAVDGVMLDDGYEKAIMTLQAVIAFDPLAVDSRIGLAKLYMIRGDKEKAMQVMDDGMKWPRPKGRSDINYLLTTAQLHLANDDRKTYAQLMSEVEIRAKRYGYTKSEIGKEKPLRGKAR